MGKAILKNKTKNTCIVIGRMFITFQVNKSDFYCYLNNLLTALSFLLVRGTTFFSVTSCISWKLHGLCELQYAMMFNYILSRASWD